MLLRLSDELLELAILHVAYSLEIEGVRGPTIVVRDVLAVASTCSVIRKASVVALEWIVSQFPSTPHDWGRVLRAPMTLSLVELRKVARDLKVHVSGTKVVVCDNILRPFVERRDNALKTTTNNKRKRAQQEWRQRIQPREQNAKSKETISSIDVPKIIPPSLLRLIHLEQSTTLFPLSQEVIEMYNYLATQMRLERICVSWTLRPYPTGKDRALVYRSFDSTACLKASYNKKKAYVEANEAITCPCGNLAANYCTQRRCRTCCVDQDCIRHATPLLYTRRYMF